MGSMMKGEKDVLTLQIKAGGPLQGITVTADSQGNVKGYVGNPDVCIPANSKGKLDVAGAVGPGFLNVIKDMGLKEPYSGQVMLQTCEIAEDLTYYFATSEQVPSAVGLGVLMNKNNTVRQAGGFIVQLMPFAEEEIDALLTRFELLDKQEKLGNELSKGMMQKVSICCALAIHPKVVMLDEPMVGLDPAAIKELKEVVLELKEKGCTILISTHMLEMVKDLWDMMFVMEQGKIIATFNKKEIADKDIEELFFEVTEPKTGGEEHE